MVPVGSTLDVYAHGLKSRLFDRHGFGSIGATHRLVKEIETINPDVIGLHNLHGYYLNIEILFNYLREVQKPVVWTFHDCWPFTGHCAYFDSVNCEKWKTECGSCPLTHAYPASWIRDNSTKNFRDKKRIFTGLENLTIVTPSRWLKDLVDQSFLSGYETRVIHNGIDLDVFRPLDRESIASKYNPEGKKIILGVASVWDRRKGLEYFTELPERLGDRYRIVLVGLDKSTINRLPDGITGIARTESLEELVAYYNLADVFANPTLTDNFPTTNLEALACGTPAVTFRTGGSPEAVDESTGIVVEKGSLEQLAESIRTIVEIGKESYSENCRKRAVKLYNKDDRYIDYLNLYIEKLTSPDLITSTN